jgi:hypothetical protein
MSTPKSDLRHVHPPRYPGAHKGAETLSASSQNVAAYTVSIDGFLTNLPLSVLVPFVRQRLWMPDPAVTNEFPRSGGSNTTVFDLFRVPPRQSLILTYIEQTWLQYADPIPDPVTSVPTVYTALPTTAGISGAAPLSIIVNNNPITDVSGAYNDANFPATDPWYPPSEGIVSSGFTQQQVNVLQFGIHRTAVIIEENQQVGALYTATYSVPLAAAELPDAIQIICKGFLAPTQVVQKARKEYGI